MIAAWLTLICLAAALVYAGVLIERYLPRSERARVRRRLRSSGVRVPEMVFEQAVAGFELHPTTLAWDDPRRIELWQTHGRWVAGDDA